MSKIQLKQREHKRIPRTASEPQLPRAERSYLAAIIAFVSVIATAMALLGYGVAVAVEDRLQIPHASMFESSFDVISLSAWAFLRFFDSLDLSTLSWDLWLTTLKATWIIPVAVFFSLVLTVYLLKSRQPWIRTGVAKTEYLLSRLKPAKHDSMGLWTIRSILISGFAWLAAPLMSFAMFFGLIMMAIGITLIPMLGMSAGIQHIDKFVVKPENCRPLQNRNIRLAAKKTKTSTTFADCLEVEVDGLEAAKGRVAFATPSAIVLYDPQTGVARRMQVKGARITLFDKL